MLIKIKKLLLRNLFFIKPIRFFLYNYKNFKKLKVFDNLNLNSDSLFIDLGANIDSTGVDTITITIPGVDTVFKVTEDNMLTRLPQILKKVYNDLGLDKELRNRLSKMTDAEKTQWKKDNAEFDIEQLLKSDKREGSTKKSTSTDPVIDGSKYNTN